MRNIETEELVDIYAQYPAHPEEPMSESQFHLEAIMMLIHNLRLMFKNRSDRVAVLGNIHWYPVEGESTNSTAPDVMVCFGVPQLNDEDRPSYAQHLENGIAPSVVFEIRSKSNSLQSIEDKRVWFQTYGVQEYYAIRMSPPSAKIYVRENNQLVEQTDITEWTSALLGISFDWSGSKVRFFNADGSLMRPLDDVTLNERRKRRKAIRRARTAEALAEQEAQRAEEAERLAQETQSQNERLREMLRQLGIDPDQPPTNS